MKQKGGLRIVTGIIGFLILGAIITGIVLAVLYLKKQPQSVQTSLQVCDPPLVAGLSSGPSGGMDVALFVGLPAQYTSRYDQICLITYPYVLINVVIDGYINVSPVYVENTPSNTEAIIDLSEYAKDNKTHGVEVTLTYVKSKSDTTGLTGPSMPFYFN